MKSPLQDKQRVDQPVLDKFNAGVKRFSRKDVILLIQESESNRNWLEYLLNRLELKLSSSLPVAESIDNGVNWNV